MMIKSFTVILTQYMKNTLHNSIADHQHTLKNSGFCFPYVICITNTLNTVINNSTCNAYVRLEHLMEAGRILEYIYSSISSSVSAWNNGIHNFHLLQIVTTFPRNTDITVFSIKTPNSGRVSNR